MDHRLKVEGAEGVGAYGIIEDKKEQTLKEDEIKEKFDPVGSDAYFLVQFKDLSKEQGIAGAIGVATSLKKLETIHGALFVRVVMNEIFGYVLDQAGEAEMQIAKEFLMDTVRSVASEKGIEIQ